MDSQSGLYETWDNRSDAGSGQRVGNASTCQPPEVESSHSGLVEYSSTVATQGKVP